RLGSAQANAVPSTSPFCVLFDWRVKDAARAAESQAAARRVLAAAMAPGALGRLCLALAAPSFALAANTELGRRGDAHFHPPAVAPEQGDLDRAFGEQIVQRQGAVR